MRGRPLIRESLTQCESLPRLRNPSAGTLAKDSGLKRSRMIRCVRVPDTDRESERATISARLRENSQRRALLAEKTAEIRTELRDLLVRGSKSALDVAEMARLAGISRDTAHRYLREAGQLSSRQRRALRKEDKDG